MEWKQYPLGAIQTNCYILSNDQNEALIIDPGDEYYKILGILQDLSLNPLAILLTHAHFDHIGAIDELREALNIPVYLHKREEDWLSDPNKNGSAHFPIIKPMIKRDADMLIENETTLSLGHYRIQVLETPGHSPGSISFYFIEDQVIFAGDTLFYGSIGRTDLYDGNLETLMESIEEKILRLPDDTTVAPGHGFETTVKHEKETNPFLYNE